MPAFPLTKIYLIIVIEKATLFGFKQNRSWRRKRVIPLLGEMSHSDKRVAVPRQWIAPSHFLPILLRFTTKDSVQIPLQTTTKKSNPNHVRIRLVLAERMGYSYAFAPEPLPIKDSPSKLGERWVQINPPLYRNKKEQEKNLLFFIGGKDGI